MRLTSFAVTDIGRLRKQNQDYVFRSEVPVGPLPNLFIVADGMGGHKAGEYASMCAVETVVDEVNLSKERGSVRVLSAEGRELARGVVNYDAETLRQLAGHRSEDFGALLADKEAKDFPEEVIHRDNLVLMV